LNTTTLANGKHSLTAVATDTSGNKATSAAVSITVNNTSTTPLTVSITSPVNGATVSGTVTVVATATASDAITGVQFLLDGANLGSIVTSSPYSISWETTQTSNGSHVLSAQVSDQAGNTATSSNVAVTVSQPSPPPPLVGDEITISDTSGSGQTNRPVSIARPFVQGEIANFAQANINGTALLTQCDVKNRWPDNSLKFAIVSFVVPTIPANGSVVVTFSNQSSGNNTGFLAQSDMLDPAFNFEAQIQLTGTASHNISARSILNAASACNDPGSDPDGGSAGKCMYWLKGPIVTAVILEDRSGRSSDVNTDGLAGNPLHPVFEAWFYPQNDLVQIGYTLEDDWASTNPTDSARDQTYSVVLTAGNASPVTEYSSGGNVTQITRTRWHKTFWLNQPNPLTSLHIDHNWGYLAQTKFTPHWDPNLQIANAKIGSEVSAFASTNQTLVGNANGIGDYPGPNQGGMNATGAAEYHGPLTTWDIIYLMSQCDTAYSTNAVCGNGAAGDMYSVMIGNADLGNGIPYFYREADASAGHGGFFDNGGTVPTQGRIVSINARTQVSLLDTTAQSCNTNYSADWINFGGSGQDYGVWGADQMDTSHWPNLAYASYISTGQYAYYEEQLMQSAYAVAASPGSRACTQPTENSSLRMGSAGYWYVDQERGTDWMAREHAIGAFIAVDGSPEKAYFTDKLNANLAVWEGVHNIPNDIGSNYATAWSYGNTSRILNPAASGTALGSWTHGPATGPNGYASNSPLCQPGNSRCTVPNDANSNFQNAYSATIIGWINDFGYCPNSCAMLAYLANHFINEALNPATNIYHLSDYVYPTLDQNGAEITSWTEVQTFYATQPTGWPVCGAQTTDEWYTGEDAAAMSYFYGLTSSQGGYSGSVAYNKIRSTMGCLSDFSNNSPKWDITPR
jgi:Bacterial Ig domain